MSQLDEVKKLIEEVGYSAALKQVRGDVIKQRFVIKSFVDSEFKEGISGDFGPIPGFGTKPTLLKPGAEKLCALFDVVVLKEVVDRRIDPELTIAKGTKTVNGFGSVEVKCTLIDRETGRVVGTGIGAASNQEGKFFKDVGDVYNNLVKYGGKRAHVDATLTLSLVSDMFTQDIEDMEKDDSKPARTAAPSRPVARNTSDDDDSNPFDDGEATSDYEITYGSHKGKTFDDPSVPDSSVQWYAKNAKTAIAENKFVGPNTQLLNAAKAAASKRGIKV